MKLCKPVYLTILFCIFTALPELVLGHDGHQQAESVTNKQIIEWLGNFHPIFLHFPIALINMAVVSELLFLWNRNPLFNQASRFMVIATAVTAIPTVLTGLAYSYSSSYEGLQASYFWWHRFLGFFTVVLTIITAVIQEYNLQRQAKRSLLFYLCLIFLFLSVNFTGHLGGSLTFGMGKLWPPFF